MKKYYGSRLRWPVSLQVLVLQISITVASTWRRRRRGISGALRSAWRVCAYVGLVLLAFASWRLRLIISAYAWFRCVDDVIDGDARIPKRTTLANYLAQKQQVFTAMVSCEPIHGEPEDALLRDAISGALQHGIDVTPELRTLWYLVNEELHFRRTGECPSVEWGNGFACAQDTSILGFCVKVCGGDHQRFIKIAPRFEGIFTRTDSLYDHPVDEGRGIGGALRHARYAEELKAVARLWEYVMPDLRVQFEALIPPGLWRQFYRQLVFQQFHSNFLEVQQQTSALH